MVASSDCSESISFITHLIPAVTLLDMAYLNEACLADRRVFLAGSTLVSPHFITRVEDATIT